MSDPGTTTSPASAPQAPTPPTRRTFRAVSPMALVAVGFGLLGLSPIAFQGGAWWFVLLVPLAVAAWVLRTRTIVDADGLRVLQLWGRRTLPWSAVATLRLTERGWVRAVRADGGEDALVGVRVRDLARLGAASGGRIRVPSPAEAEAAAEHERELAAARLRVERLRAQQAEQRAQLTESAEGHGAEESPENASRSREDGTEESGRGA